MKSNKWPRPPEHKLGSHPSSQCPQPYLPCLFRAGGVGVSRGIPHGSAKETKALEGYVLPIVSYKRNGVPLMLSFFFQIISWGWGWSTIGRVFVQCA